MTVEDALDTATRSPGIEVRLTFKTLAEADEAKDTIERSLLGDGFLNVLSPFSPTPCNELELINGSAIVFLVEADRC